jgi:hypothetical protein
MSKERNSNIIGNEVQNASTKQEKEGLITCYAEMRQSVGHPRQQDTDVHVYGKILLVGGENASCRECTCTG